MRGVHGSPFPRRTLIGNSLNMPIVLFTYGIYSVKLKIVMVSVTHEEAKIIIVDDHALARESIHKMLESEPHLQVLAEARDGQELIELCRLQHPDLVLMDVGMPKVNGFEATRIIKA